MIDEQIKRIEVLSDFKGVKTEHIKKAVLHYMEETKSYQKEQGATGMTDIAENILSAFLLLLAREIVIDSK